MVAGGNLVSRSHFSSLFESSRLAEFECVILPGYVVRQKMLAFDSSFTKAV